jgi:hypothetical protein
MAIHLPAKLPTDIDELLRNKMQDIEALIEAIMNEDQDCDLKLAELIENENERGRIAIVEKLREMLRARAEEKEKELDKYLEQQRRAEVSRQRNALRQWLTWIMSEETLRKIREAFMASPMLENLVRGLGHNLANKGVKTEVNPAYKQDLGELSANIAQSQAAQREKEKKDKGRG